MYGPISPFFFRVNKTCACFCFVSFFYNPKVMPTPFTSHTQTLKFSLATTYCLLLGERLGVYTHVFITISWHTYICLSTAECVSFYPQFPFHHNALFFCDCPPFYSCCWEPQPMPTPRFFNVRCRPSSPLVFTVISIAPSGRRVVRLV